MLRLAADENVQGAALKTLATTGTICAIFGMAIPSVVTFSAIAGKAEQNRINPMQSLYGHRLIVPRPGSDPVPRLCAG